MDFPQSDYLNYSPQSGIDGVNTSVNAPTGAVQTLTFDDGTSETAYEVISQPDVLATVSDPAGYADFFSRPVIIREYEWNSNLFGEEFNPWSDFFNNKRVTNRICNFNRLRATLHVKFMITGNSFLYGRLAAVYTPRRTGDTMTKDRFIVPQDFVAGSQRPHLLLDPSESVGGELILPFVWEYDSFNIPDFDFDSLGRIVVRQLNPLQSANDNLLTSRITVVAWATDVTMSGLTHRSPLDFVPQSGSSKTIKPGMMADEYGQGIISKPATLVAKIAGRLTNIPVIAPYARATNIAAGAVGNIASLFGYSRPAIIETISPFRPTFNGNITNMDAPDSSTRLTLDTKQEVTIDTRVCGLDGEDEMIIQNIATRQSYLTTFSWTEDRTPDFPLIDIKVRPSTYTTFGTGALAEIHMPACCFASQPFQYWRGTMKYRFQVVCTQYHRGRLKIVYDPEFNSPNPELNTNHTYIVDIAENRDFTIDIGYTQTEGFLHIPVIVGNNTGITNPGQLHTQNFNSNGSLTVYVQNDLTSPALSLANIQINVYMSCHDDIEFMSPTDSNINALTLFQPQLGMEPQSGIQAADLTVGAISPGANLSDIPTHGEEALSIYAGEAIVSFRQLLKRYSYMMYIPVPEAGERFNNIILPNVDFFPGYDPNGLHLTENDEPYTYCNMSMSAYISTAYLGYRGSLRRKYIYETSDEGDNLDYLAVRRSPESKGYRAMQSEPAVNLSQGESAGARYGATNYGNALSGIAITQRSKQPCLEVELPYQIDKRFLIAKKLNRAQLADSNDFLYHQLKFNSDTRIQYSAGIHVYTSVGEDYNLAWFLGPPVYYLRGEIPLPKTP